MDFIEAKHYTKVSGARSIDVIVIHTMEAAEKPGTARKVAKWFAGDDAPQTSAHYCIDDQEIVQCVKEQDVAWAAPGANKNGIHLEHAGFAAQQNIDWQDAYSQAMLARSAALCAGICRRYSIPAERIGVEDLLANHKGICGHVDVSDAFHKSDHRDPGGNFPWNQFIGMVRKVLTPPAPQPTVDPAAIA